MYVCVDRWGDNRSPAFGELSDSHFFRPVEGSKEDRLAMWGQARFLLIYYNVTIYISIYINTLIHTFIATVLFIKYDICLVSDSTGRCVRRFCPVRTGTNPHIAVV